MHGCNSYVQSLLLIMFCTLTYHKAGKSKSPPSKLNIENIETTNVNDQQEQVPNADPEYESLHDADAW